MGDAHPRSEGTVSPVRLSTAERHAERRARVLCYLRERGYASARDVTVDVFGGSGRTRTTARGTTTQLLHVLAEDGLVTRTGDGTNASPYLWRAL